MKRILVLGIGNRLLMDDGIGVEVVEAIMQNNHWGNEMKCEIGETDFDYCIDAALEADYLIIIDSAMTGRNPGEVAVFPLSELEGSKPGISLHNLHFLDLIHQFEQCHSGILIGIEPYQIDVHWGISQELKDRFDVIVKEVKQIIEEYVQMTEIFYRSISD